MTMIINWELGKQIFRDMQRHKIRSFLAMFGIIWGTVAVIMLFALGEGFYQAGQKSMWLFAQGTIFVNPSATSKPYRGIPSKTIIHIKADDIASIKNAVPTLQLISPLIQTTQKITYQTHTINATVEGIAPSYEVLAKQHPEPDGRFINALDIAQQRNVIFLSADVKDKLFQHINPLGKNIYLYHIPFTVIGVEKKGPIAGMWYKNPVRIPYTTALKLWGNKDINTFIVLPYPSIDHAIFLNQLKSYLAYRYHFDPTDSNAVRILDFSKELAFFKWFFHSIEVFLGFCGTLTLAVGGISVANIMFLIVSERQSEIGLKMALGARYHHILWQFLLEASLIIVLGSLIGFLLSISGIIILQHVSLPEWLGTPQFSLEILFITIIVLAVIGFIAGYFPARRAANMQPIEALAF